MPSAPDLWDAGGVARPVGALGRAAWGANAPRGGRGWIGVTPLPKSPSRTVSDSEVSEEVERLCDLGPDCRGGPVIPHPGHFWPAGSLPALMREGFERGIQEMKEKQRQEQEDERQELKKMEEGKTYWNGEPYGCPPKFVQWQRQMVRREGKSYWDGRYHLVEMSDEDWKGMLTAEQRDQIINRFESGRAYEREVQTAATKARLGDARDAEDEVEPRSFVPNPSARFGVRIDGGDEVMPPIVGEWGDWEGKEKGEPGASKKRKAACFCSDGSYKSTQHLQQFSLVPCHKCSHKCSPAADSGGVGKMSGGVGKM